MSISTNDKITKNSIASTINELIRNKIYNNVTIDSSNIANYTTDATLKSKFESKSNLTSFSASSISDSIINGNISTILSSYLDIWGKVVYISIIHYTGNNTNGGTVTYSSAYTVDGAWAMTNETNNSFKNQVSNSNITTGKLISASNLNSYFNELYNKWSSTNRSRQYSYKTCHSNCHSDCHGSGSWR